MASLIPKSKAKTAYGLLGGVCAVITAEPLRLDMQIVCLRDPAAVSVRYNKSPVCGTVGCIAGWALTLNGKTTPQETNYGVTWYAAELLGLDSTQEEELFQPRRLMGSNQQTAQHAERVVAHIRKFQKKYRAQLIAKQV